MDLVAAAAGQNPPARPSTTKESFSGGCGGETSRESEEGTKYEWRIESPAAASGQSVIKGFCLLKPNMKHSVWAEMESITFPSSVWNYCDSADKLSMINDFFKYNK